jgi:hypothetical protein
MFSKVSYNQNLQMNTNQKIGRVAGLLLLLIFINGIFIFQFLQGPILFSDNFLTSTAANSNQIVGSVVLGIFSGIVSIVIATILLPVFKRQNSILAYLYLAFCIINCFAIMIDNVSVISMLELSKEYVNNENNGSLKVLGSLAYEKHWWTHYFYLLTSCFPVFVLYYTLFVSKLVPRLISIFGLIAVLLMFIEELFSIFGQSIGMNMLLPIALIQLVLPLWLIYKGLNTVKAEAIN